MVAQGDAQHLLGLVLLDDEPVEVVLNLARFILELELVRFGLPLGALRRDGICGVRRRRLPASRRCRCCRMNSASCR